VRLRPGKTAAGNEIRGAVAPPPRPLAANPPDHPAAMAMTGTRRSSKGVARRGVVFASGLPATPSSTRRPDDDTTAARHPGRALDRKPGLRLLRLGARVIEIAPRIRLAFAAARPEATLIPHLAAALMPPGR
jgi:hypothetical protein